MSDNNVDGKIKVLEALSNGTPKIIDWDTKAKKGPRKREIFKIKVDNFCLFIMNILLVTNNWVKYMVTKLDQTDVIAV